MLRIKKNDLVYVISGKDRAKTGKVLKVYPRQNTAIVEGVNFVKKHMRRRSESQPGGVIQMECPLHLSNLALYCRACNRPTRAGFSNLKDGTKARFCKRCKETI